MIFHVGNAIHYNRPIASELGKKTDVPGATGLDYSTGRNDNYQTDDFYEKPVTERFSQIWNKIQGIYPGKLHASFCVFFLDCPLQSPY